MKTPVLALASLITLGLAAQATAQTAPVTAPPAPPVVMPPAPPIPPELKDSKALDGYAIGLNIGASMKRDGVDVDPAMVARGITDQMSGGKTLITMDQAHDALAQLQASMTAAKQAAAAKAAAENKAAGEAFLKANGAKPGIVTLPDGLQYQVVTAGKGPIPKDTDTVSVNYRGTLLDGTEFDSSTAHGGPQKFPVGQIIKGWTEALEKMPVGSKWRLFIPADLAYGDRGAGQAIGPGSTLIFDVELLSIEPPAK